MTRHDYAEIERDLDAARVALEEHDERSDRADDSACEIAKLATHLDEAARGEFRDALIDVIADAFSPHWHELHNEVTRLERILERHHEEQERLP